jgi:hypothetical protein
MSTTVGHHDRPPAAGALPKVPAASRSRRSMLALAAVETGRLLRHPAVLAATALSAWLLWRAGANTVPVLHYADIATQLELAPLAAAALLATNLAVLRPHRDGAVDLQGATRLTLARRTMAHLLSVLPLVALGAVLVAADLAWLAGVPGRTGSPNAAEAATGPALIVLGGCLGVLLGRLWRSVALAPLVLVVVAAGSLTLAQLYIGGHDTRPYVWLGTLLSPVTPDPPPAALLGRPASWHLVYLLGAAAVLGALAVGRSQAQARVLRRPEAATAVVLVAALAVTTAAAVVQTRPTSPALAARWLAAARDPAAQLVCQRRGPAVYCVFPGFEPQIGLWEPTVRAVVAGVPPTAAARALPVTVAQRVGWFHLIEEDEPGAAVSPGVGQGVGQLGRPVAPISTTWGRQGQLLADTQARLAVNVAARLVAPPDTVTSPSGAGSKSNPGPGPSAPDGCNARAVVALWLAARVSPQAAEGIRRGLTHTPDPTFTLTHDADIDDVSWGVREGRFALALLERPGDQVAQIVWGNWDLLTRPDTTLERLGELLGVQPPPDSPDVPDASGPAC